MCMSFEEILLKGFDFFYSIRILWGMLFCVLNILEPDRYVKMMWDWSLGWNVTICHPKVLMDVDLSRGGTKAQLSGF